MELLEILRPLGYMCVGLTALVVIATAIAVWREYRKNNSK